MTDDEIALRAAIRAIVVTAIDTGAACYKARSFIVVDPGKPARSVYDVLTDQAVAVVREREARRLEAMLVEMAGRAG